MVHAAGTVKGHVDPALLRRGVRVSSAAAANAVPVAEFTVAAILLAGKRAFRLQRRYRELRGFRLWWHEVPPIGNYRKVVGIVGASRIGRLVIERLRAFDFAAPRPRSATRPARRRAASAPSPSRSTSCCAAPTS